MNLLVTDGDQRAALAMVRSLGQAGHRVWVASSRSRSLAGASRWAAGQVRFPDALHDPAGFVQATRDLVRARELELLLPVTEAALLALLPERDALDAVLPFPAAEDFRRISDKQAVLEEARALGIHIPEQRVLSGPDAAHGIRPEALHYPLVLKPSRSVAGGGQDRRKLTVRHVADPDAWRRILPALPPAAYPLLVQQRVVGPGIGVFLLLWEGREVARFGHRRIREKPPAGGVSVYRESVAVDPALHRLSRALLDRFHWRGVAMVEYKVDAASGTPYLMEVNGRFWGSLQLAIDAGVDFPALLVALASGRPVAAVPEYRLGVRSRWFWGDVDHLVARLRSSARALGLPPDAPSRWTAVREFLRPGGAQDRAEVLRRDDPAPFFRETFDWLLRR